MKSKPLVMEYFSTVHTSYVVNFTFTNNITILTGSSGTGKTAVFSFIRECTATNPDILCLNYLDYQKSIKEILASVEGKLVVIDNADVILDDAARKFISLDGKNQYLIIGRNPGNLFATKENLFELVSEKKGEKTEFRIRPYLMSATDEFVVKNFSEQKTVRVKKSMAASKRAREFADKWRGRGYEKGESQTFWLDLLHMVLGVENPTDMLVFEQKVKLDNTSFIDIMIPSTHVMIEQKSLGKDLKAPIKQSDGTMLTPIQQAKRYAAELPYSARPRWIVTCNFSTFHVYDMENPNAEPAVIELKDLPKEAYRLAFLVKTQSESVKKELELSLQAGELVGKLYKALLKEYKNPNDEHSQKSLNMLCVRLVFAMYCEDIDGLLGDTHNMFAEYLKLHVTPAQKRRALLDLFAVLDTPVEERDPYLDPELAAFPYVNGGLFEEKNIEIPMFTPEITDLIINKASEGFNWSEISPTIFGAVFESTLNPETRRSGGMHYTAVEQIHKVIDPLFLDDLKDELAQIKEIKVAAKRRAALEAFRDKLASLTFFDPACGSGNFLTLGYTSLRKLENEALLAETGGQVLLDIGEPIKVSISQFYGLEINDFAVTVAKTALWIAESQMMKETEEIINAKLDFLPLKSYANIVEGNALRLDWQEVVPREKVNYIMGNPPFVGARIMSKEQKADINAIFQGWKNVGNLDYVSGWYKKASDFMQGTNIRAALVSTNSVSQGDAVATLWKPLFAAGVHIDFAHRTFRWDSEATEKAHVHCVIIGFSHAANAKPKYLYTAEQAQQVSNINAYLLEADDVFIESRSKPLCDVPSIGIGNKPIDDGNYLFEKAEMEEFIKSEPASAKYFRPWYGSREFINGTPRYCLWLGDCSPAELRKMPHCIKRVEAVRQFRLKSSSAVTVKLADKPTHFHVENIPDNDYIVIPKVSSEQRRYVPMGMLSKENMASDLLFIMPNATLYHFGVLISNVHMAWMRAVAGRLEMRYRYSKDIVYNNFPWCKPTDEQKATIEKTAQGILNARAKYPDSSLADLYNETAMPSELRAAHRANDKAVMQAYGFWGKINTESECVAALMKMYQELTK